MQGIKLQRSTVLIFFLFTTSALCAQIPKLISYQGILTDNNGQVLTDGNYTITVKIFDALTGGNELWSEDHSITLFSGLFNIALGSNTDLDLPFNQPYYISTTVDGTELLPRSAITASPSYQNYTVAPIHQSQVVGLFGGKTYASSEEAIAAVTTAWKEVAGLDVNEVPHMKYILEHPEQAEAVINDYSARLSEQQNIAKNFLNR